MKLKNIKKQSKNIAITTLMFFCFIPLGTQAEIPNHINYQGKLKDDTGSPITSSTTIQFSLYSHITNGSPVDLPSSAGPLLWTETYDGSSSGCAQITPGTNGIFAQQLGTCVNFPSYLDFTDEYYLGVKIGADAEATPRVPFATNPYAFTSKAVHVENEDVNISTETSGNIILNSAGNIQLQANDVTSAFVVDQQGTGNLFELQNNGATSFIVDGNGFVGIGSGAVVPTEQLHIAGNMRLEGALYDVNNESGTSGQILSSTSTGVDWLDVSSLMDNIYIADGSLTGSRVLNKNGHFLNFAGEGNLQFMTESIATIATFQTNANGAQFMVQNSDPFNVQEQSFRIDTSSMLVTDDRNSRGVEYDDNYHANYTDRTLVDKEYVDNGMMWESITHSMSANNMSPIDSNISMISMENNTGGQLTINMLTNRNDVSNYAGAVFAVKGSGADYTNNMYFGKYSDNYYVNSWAGNGVMATDQDMIITSAGSNDATNPNVDPRILFQVGGGYTAPIDRAVIDENGNLGVGELNPTERTVIDGNLHTLQTEAPKLKGSMIKEFGSPRDIHVVGDYAYITAEGSNRLFVLDISDQTNPVIVGAVSDGLSRPYSVFISGEYAYVTDIGSQSLVIFDISNPKTPKYVSSISDRLADPRDVYVSGNRAFVVNRESAILAVFDVTDQYNPILYGSTDQNIKTPVAVYISGEYAYIADENDNVAVFDINMAHDPKFLSSIGDIKNPNDIYVSGRYAYVTSLSSETLNVIDVSNPEAISYMSNVNLNIDGPRSVWISGDYAYVVGGKTGIIGVYNITDSMNMEYINRTVGTLDGSKAIFVSDKHAYVVGSVNDGMAIYELNHTQTPNLVTGSLSAADLQVLDNAQFDNDIYVWGGATIGDDLSVQHNLSVNGTSLFVDNVGIGTLEPTRALQIGENGDGTSAVANAWTTFSDERYKKNIEPIEGALDKILELEGVEYEWKNNNEETIGLIAQEVKEVLPEIVFEDKDGYYSIDYSKITPVLVNAIKEQQEQINNIDGGGNIITELVEGVRGILEEIIFKAEVEFEEAVTFISETVFTDKVTFMDRVTYTSEDISGVAIIEEGNNKIEIEFSQSFTFKPVVTAVVNNAFVLFKVTDVSEDGFTIEIQEKAEKDIEFTWQTVSVVK